jgi:hypothetical protein
MIVTSNDFKKAIKNEDRQLKGYVEVLYKHEDINAEVSSEGIGTDVLPIVMSTEKILYDSRISTDYATLENNYFKLDGSFILPNQEMNKGTGYISNHVASYYETKKIKIENIENNSTSNITIYFKDNIPSMIKLIIKYEIDSEINIFKKSINNNINDVVYFEFDEISNIESIEFIFDNFEYDDRRIRIPKIEFGITNIYKNNDLVNFSLIEQISEFNTEMPVDECDVTIDNYDNKFDLINPTGLVKYLNDNVQVNPYIGIVTETNGIEYIKMGVYYLQGYTNNNDKTTTFHCEKNFRKLANSKSYFRTKNYISTVEEYFNAFCDYCKIDNRSFNATTENNRVIDSSLPLLKKLEQFNMLATFGNIIVRNGRNDDMIAENINNEINDELTLNEVKKVPEFSLKTVLKSVTINQPIWISEQVKETFDPEKDYIVLFDGDIVVDKDNPFIIEMGSLAPTGSRPKLTFEPAIQMWEFYDYGIQDGYYFATTGNLTGSYHLLVRVSTMFKENIQYKIFSIKQNDEGVEFEINNEFYNDNNNSQESKTSIQNTLNYIKDNYKKYDVKIDYFGNPAYEVNDVLKVETPYGYKNVRILKHTLTFNGSLSGTIEGVGD